jgi:predicted transcriptional regulator
MSARSSLDRSLHLSRRERQIMDVVYAARQVSAAEVRAGLPDPPSYSAVRALLRILVDKGHLKHRNVGGKYLYTPTHPRENVARSALQRVLQTFFDNSATKAVAALLDASDGRLSDAELNQLQQLLDDARKQGQS